METSHSAPTRKVASLKNLALTYGGMASVLMIVFFFVINAIGWQRYEAARFGSHAFTVLAVLLAMRAYKARSSHPAPYLPGLALGFLVGLVGSVLFAAFIFGYANFLNPAYQTELQGQMYWSSSVNGFVLAASITLLGVVIGSLVGYIVMMSEDTSPATEFDKSMNSGG